MHVIALCHLKGGVGKTTGAVNLAYFAARAGYRTVCWDLDPQGAAAWCLGCDAAGPPAKRLVKMRLSAVEAAVPTAWPGLDCIGAHATLRNLDLRLDDADRPEKILRRLLKPLGRRYDVVVIDCPPGLSRLSEAVFRAADTLLMPMIPSDLSLRAHDQVVQELERLQVFHRQLYAYFSMVDRRRASHRRWVDTPPPAIPNLLEVSIPASVDNERVAERRAPVHTFAPRGRSSRAWQSLWEALVARIDLPGAT
ncbi:cellulose biosynthesis protein BcsQ [Natronocella acetinitrilica]|uniref:Cellulose biosynthesis protein BcsQ n=1 Tax=Natronocella acetinitrilica TaxID=414046 RepID=A0AAE3G3T5_9GAMM|nr:cellulose biosynthesis protein BcsQ [Natronocella acetinitrilica]